MTSLKLAVIPGDGIGPEVTAEALKVLEVAAPADVKFEQTSYDLGAERYLATGEVLPDSVLAEIREHDAILLGAVGGKPNDPNLPPGILERGLLLRLRFELDHYVNLRPSRIFPGAVLAAVRRRARQGQVDFVVVREGTEGPYTGNGGALRVGTPQEIATEVSVNTAYGVERVRPRRVRPRGPPAAQEAHPGPQDQRARPRRVGLVAARSRRWRTEFPDVTARLHARRRGDDLPGHRPGPVRRDRHRQPVRRHHHRPRRRDHRRHRARGLREHQPGPDRAQHVRAGARLGARHRRPAEGRPDRGDPLGRAAARPPRATPTRLPPSRPPRSATSPTARPGPRPVVLPRSAMPSRPGSEIP